MRSVPELSSEVTGVVQGVFIGKDRERIPFEEVFNLLKDDASIMAALGEMSGDQEQQERYLKTALRKVEEGCDQLVDGRESGAYRLLVKKVISFLGLIKKGQPVRPKEAVLLKINRLAGSLQKRAGTFGDLKPISLGLDQHVKTCDFSVFRPVLLTAIPLIMEFKGQIERGNTQGQWHRFESLSLFGPLFHALLILNPEMEGDARTIDLELREIRQLMETNPAGISVVAHRGMGPTNRSMGGLIAQDDPRRLNRPAENSPEAFGVAMGFARGGGLDGVECDVFLSRDRVPILSHEEKVREQLSAEMKAQYRTLDDGQRVGDLDSQTLLGLQRTKAKDSRFMTLEELLDMVAPVAAAHYGATGKPFRVEVEMKGTNIKGWNLDQEGRNRREMEVRVTRVISQFKKTMPDIPIEILLFNGNVEEVRGYARKRREKTALGAIYTGLNVKPWGEKSDGSKSKELKPSIDELRYMMSADPSFLFTKRQKQDFITTLVYDVETAPPSFAPRDMQPTGIVNKGRGEMVYPNPLNDFQRLIALLGKGLTKGPNKIHLLTDYAGKAPYMKNLLSGAVRPEDIQGVFDVFFAIADNIQDNLSDKLPIPIDQEHHKPDPDGMALMIQKFARDTMEALKCIESFLHPDSPMQGLVVEARARAAVLEAAASPTAALAAATSPAPVPHGGRQGVAPPPQKGAKATPKAKRKTNPFVYIPGK